MLTVEGRIARQHSVQGRANQYKGVALMTKVVYTDKEEALKIMQDNLMNAKLGVGKTLSIERPSKQTDGKWKIMIDE
jgi:hypothetical protein